MITAEFIRQSELGNLVNFEGQVDDVIIDSRKVSPGAMFFALQGKNADGHRYVKSALENGAVLCAVSQKWVKNNRTEGLPLWIVESPEKALQGLAKQWRAQFNIPVLGITGTNGKTTTRSMCASILGKKYNLHATQGNFNNHLGLPLTILKMNPEHSFSILELGTNHLHEITFLAELCQPTAALITNIGYGHTEFFGGIEGVTQAKAELFESIDPDGTCFINLNDENIRKIVPNTKLVSFGMDIPEADFNGKIISYDENACATLVVNDDLTIKLKVPGKAMAQNALAAIAVGMTYSVSAIQIKDALESFDSIDQRFAVTQARRCRIINDAYNANPNSTRAALETFSKMSVNGRKLFVFADMFELGDLAADGHRDIGKEIINSPIDVLFTYGPLSKITNKVVQKSGEIQTRHFSSKPELIEMLKNSIRPSDTILFKGSRGNRLEEIIEGINI